MKRKVLAAACSAAMPVCGLGQEGAPAADRPVQMETVVVTASGRPQPIADVQASVQVISDRDLEAYPGTSVTDGLKMAVGVDARAYGATATVAIRGLIAGAGSPVLTLVNGLRRPAKYGVSNLNLYELENVERVEIVRGPMSALFGADAMGGVINIITRSPIGNEGASANLRGLVGATADVQRDTYYAGGTVAFGTGEVRHRFSAEYRTRQEFRYDEAAFLTDLGNVDQTFATYEGGLQLAPGHTLRWTLEYLRQDDTAPGLLAAAPPTRPRPVAYESFESETRWFGALRYMGDIGPGTLSVDLSYGDSDGSTTRSFPVIETTDYGQLQAQALYSLPIGPHFLTAGLGTLQDDVDVSINSKSVKRTNGYALIQDEWTISREWRALLGLRYDTFTDFGSVVSPRASILYSPGPWSLRAGYGQGFRAPSPLEQYSSFLRGRFLIVGDPNLQPEESKSWEIAAAWNTRELSAEVVYFNSVVTNLIQTVTRPRQPGDPLQVLSRAVYANVAEADISGVEANAAWQFFPAWWVGAGWEYLSAIDASTGQRLTQRSRQVWRANLRYEQGPWRADLLTRYYVDFYNSDPAIRNSAPYNTNYGTTEFKLDYLLAPHWTFSAGMQNIFNRQQPVNWNNVGAVMDPPARFLYANVRYSM